MHSFWYGDESGDHGSIHYEYYTEMAVLALAGDRFEVVVSGRYAEIDSADSFYILLRKLDDFEPSQIATVPPTEPSVEFAHLREVVSSVNR